MHPTNNQPYCDDTCNNHNCPVGYQCRLQQLPCFYPPCRHRRHCVKIIPEDPCEQPNDRGNGQSALLRWWFDGSVGKCKRFLWSGRGGNSNNFRKREHCERKCTPRGERATVLCVVCGVASRLSTLVHMWHVLSHFDDYVLTADEQVSALWRRMKERARTTLSTLCLAGSTTSSLDSASSSFGMRVEAKARETATGVCACACVCVLSCCALLCSALTTCRFLTKAACEGVCPPVTNVCKLPVHTIGVADGCDRTAEEVSQKRGSAPLY